MDEELRKAFGGLQLKMVETQQRVRISEAQINGLQRNNLHATLTDKEMAGLPEGTRTYESIGRMFLLKSVPQVREMLRERTKDNNSKIKKLEEQKEYLEKNVKESQDNLREMVRQRQARA